MKLFNSWNDILEMHSKVGEREDVFEVGDADVVDRCPYVERDDGEVAMETRGDKDGPDVGYLNVEQKRAYDIIMRQARAEANNENPQQLLMIVIGAGGVGKSVLINSLSDGFEWIGARELLAKTATSGVASTLIGGSTLHWWAGIPVTTPKKPDFTSRSSKEIEARRS
jgi:hypothetical protein